MEQAQGPETPGPQGQAAGEEGAGAALARQLLSPEASRSQQAQRPLPWWVGHESLGSRL